MKKLLASILLTLVVGVGAFSKVYIATKDSEKTLEKAFSDAYQIAVKEYYEELVDLYSDKGYDCTLLVYFDTKEIKTVEIFSKPTDEGYMGYMVEIKTDKGKSVGSHYVVYRVAVDPVWVGLYFLNEEVYAVFDADGDTLLGLLGENK